MMPFGVAGFLYNPDTKKVLLHLRDGNTTEHPNQWAFFGGLGEAGETPLQAFVREIQEEIGVALDSATVVSFSNQPGQAYGHRYSFYAETTLAEADVVLSEGAGFGWISLDDVFGYNLTPKTRMDLEDFVKQL